MFVFFLPKQSEYVDYYNEELSVQRIVTSATLALQQIITKATGCS